MISAKSRVFVVVDKKNSELHEIFVYMLEIMK